MTTSDVAVYQDSITNEHLQLSVDEVRRVICPNATELEAVKFIRLCQSQGLNPWVNDAYLIKYGADRPATMVVGKDAFTKRAEAFPQYSGMESGVVVRYEAHQRELEYRTGTLVLDNEVIVGGWCKVYRTDRQVPTNTTVSMGEYNTGQSMWKKMPATMIEKVAIVKALRTAFPQAFAGMYDSVEMDSVEVTEGFEPSVAIEASKPPSIKEKKAPVAKKAPVIEETIDQMNDVIENIKDTEGHNEEPDDDPVEPPPEAPHMCKMHDVVFELMTSEKTGESKYCHSVVASDGATRWCVEG